MTLKKAGFNVPPFLYMPAEDFGNKDFERLKTFLKEKCDGFKVIIRSCHPAEDYYKGGTFDSLETYADVGGVEYARNRIIKSAHEEKSLSILRQQKFQDAPPIKLEDTGVMVMPFLEGTSAMAKVIGDHWEFGYSRSRTNKFQNEPYITHTPHDLRLLNISEEVEKILGFRSEIEFIVTTEGEIFVVQAKDISKIETLDFKETESVVHLDGIRRIRKRRNYRERPIFVLDSRAMYMDVISSCEDLVHGCPGDPPTIGDIVGRIDKFEREIQEFALRHERFCVLGLSVEVPEDLFQVANNYLDETPEMQKELSKKLYGNQYKVDQFLAEADTIIGKDKFRRNLCSHDAYGINNVRNPIWSLYWREERHRQVVNDFIRLGYRTGDYVGMDIDEDDKPLIYRL